MTERVGVFIDGYNVYYGMIRKQWRQYLWLNYQSLFEDILMPSQTLVSVDYFTAWSGLHDSRRRQEAYMKALGTCDLLTAHFGKMERRPTKCAECGHRWKRQQEKESDVALALAMFRRSVNDEVDTLFLMTRDTDLTPAVREVVGLGKKVVIVKPPLGTGRGEGAGDALVQASGNRAFHVRRSSYIRSQFPPIVPTEFGDVVRPTTWA